MTVFANFFEKVRRKQEFGTNNKPIYAKKAAKVHTISHKENNLTTIGIVGASGLAGEAVKDILQDKLGDKIKLRLFGNTAAGKRLQYGAKWITIEPTENATCGALDFALLMCPNEVSTKIVPILAKKGVVCIDNSSAFRLNDQVPLVVRQINGDKIGGNIIANPNCVTIQVAIALHALKKFCPERITVATYQSASGAGKEGLADLTERRTIPQLKCFSQQIFDNVIPKIGEILPDGFTAEERKMQDELPKILDDNKLQVNCFAARVPVSVGHCAFVNVQFGKPFTVDEIRQSLKSQPNILLMSDDLPTPRILCHTKYVAIGRIVEYLPTNSVNMFVVADNLLRGAAYNAWEILEQILQQNGCIDQPNGNGRCASTALSDVTPTATTMLTANPNACKQARASQNTRETFSTPFFSKNKSANIDTNQTAKRLYHESKSDKNKATTSAATQFCAGDISKKTDSNQTTTPNKKSQAETNTDKHKSNKLLITALATPYLDGKIDIASLEKLCETQNGQADCVVVCSTTGEGDFLHEQEKIRIIDVTRNALSNTPLWVGVTQNTTDKAVRWAKIAADKGANGLLICPPSFVKCTKDGYISHIVAIQNATKLPVMLYNVPSRCGYNLDIDAVRQLSVSGNVFVKDCTDNIAMLAAAPQKLLCGSDELLPQYLAANAKGIVSVASNAAPKLARLALTNADCLVMFCELAKTLSTEINPIGIKYLLYKLHLFRSCDMRLPLTKANAATMSQIDSFADKFSELLR